MAGYQRMVSYLYEYNEGEKGENVGYARLEIRENIAKMIISIRMRRDISASCPVELYYWEGKRSHRIEVGWIALTNGRADGRILLQDIQVGNDLAVTQMNGMIISLPGGMIGSAWDDQPVPVCALVESPEVKRQELAEQGLAEQELIEQELSEQELPRMEELQAAELQAAEVVEGDLEGEVMPEGSWELTGFPVPTAPTREEEASEPRPSSSLQSFDYFFQNGTRMCPFEDASITDCVRIEPADLEYLPRETWILGSNSFLLHGYYTYGHLILAKIKGMGKESTILGVPGQYQNRERFLAKMFGFEHFKSIGNSSTEGNFGYWYLFLPERVDQ